MIANYSPEVAGLARRVFAWMRRKFPRACVLVYDNYNALVMGFGPSERASEAAFSIALYPRWVNLFFLQGAHLPDPKKLLQGAGKQVRGIRLEDVRLLDDPAVLALIEAAAARIEQGAGSGKIVIRAIAAKQRSRRPSKRAKGARSI